MSEDMEDQAVYDINVDVTAVLGTASLLVNQLLKLGRGAVVELGQNVGDPIDLRINNACRTRRGRCRRRPLGHLHHGDDPEQ